MKEWEERLLKEAREIVKHGWGRLEFQANEIKGNRTKLTVLAGKSYSFIIAKRILD